MMSPTLRYLAGLAVTVAIPLFAQTSPSVQLASSAPGCVSVERASLTGMPAGWSAPRPGSAPLAAATFARELDRSWRRTSYSDITAAAHEARVASEPEERVVDDAAVGVDRDVRDPAGGEAGTEAPEPH